MRFISSTVTTLSLLALFLVPLLLSGDAATAFAQAEGEAGQLARWTIIPLLQSVGAFLITLGAFIMWISGILLNYAIQFGIVDFAQFANISGIATAWAVLRDVTNMAFIFIFLAIGISTILGIQRYAVGRLLPMLLIVAILVNFSLFATRAVIDVGHTFAGAILNQSGVVENQCEEINAAGVADCSLTHGVSAAFIEQFGFVNIFGASAEVALGAGGEAQQGVYGSIFSGDTWGEAWMAVLFGLFSFIFMSLAGVIFLAGAVILIMRIVMLLLLMIAAAPAFAAAILPDTRQYFRMWLNRLLKETFFAPILLLLFAISLLFLNTARNTAGIGPDANASFAEIFLAGGVESVNLIVILIIGLGFLFMSIKIAQDLGTTGAGTAMKVQNWGTRRVAAATASPIAFGGRFALGRGGAAAASAVRQSGFGRSSLGRFTASAFDQVADASYDPRALGDKKVVGKPGKGFVSRSKDRAKEEVKYAKTLQNTREERAMLAGLAAQKKELENEKRKDPTATKAALEAQIAEAQKQVPEAVPEAERVFMTDEQRAEHDQKVADAETKVADLKAQAAAVRDTKTIDEDLKKIKEQETNIKNRPKEKYARALEREPVFTTRQFEVTEEGRPVATQIVQAEDEVHKLEDAIEKLASQVEAAGDATERAALIARGRNLRDDLALAREVLDDARNDRSTLQSTREYVARTGDLTGHPVGAFPTETSGKLAGAQAIRKELKKDDATKTRDALVEALKSESSDDKKEKEDA